MEKDVASCQRGPCGFGTLRQEKAPVAHEYLGQWSAQDIRCFELPCRVLGKALGVPKRHLRRARRTTKYIPRTKTVEREAGVLHYVITSASHWSLYVKLQVMTAQPSCESVMNPHAYAECVPLKWMWKGNQDIQCKKGHLCGLKASFITVFWKCFVWIFSPLLVL